MLHFVTNKYFYLLVSVVDVSLLEAIGVDGRVADRKAPIFAHPWVQRADIHVMFILAWLAFAIHASGDVRPP